MGLYKRDRVWWMSIAYGGRQVRRSTGTTDKRLAEAILAKTQVKIIEGRYFDVPAEPNRTFGELMHRYLEERSVLKAPQSLGRDKSSSRHLLSVFGEKKLREIFPRDLATYKARRRKEGAAAATINKELQLVRHAFNVAIREWEWCRDNPMHKVSLERVHNQVDRWLTSEEEARLLAAAPQWLRDIVVTALHTGMRKGEILALRWPDVDFKRGTLIVMHSKNRERRTIPLNGIVFALLARKRSAWKEGSELVFATSHETALGTRNVARAFSHAVRRAGVPNFRFHDLRHTFATRLVQRGVDLYKVQRLLGHKTGMMTQRYAHHSPDSLRDGVARLEAGEPVRAITISSQ